MDTQGPIVIDKAVKPTGVVPPGLQARVIIVLAVVMVLVIAFSSRREDKKRVDREPEATLDTDRARIREIKERIEQQAKRLQADHAQLLEAKRQMEPLPAPEPGASQGERPPSERGYGEPYRDESPRPPERDWRLIDREKREYLSLYADSVVKSFRDTESGAGSATGGGAANSRPEASDEKQPPKRYKVYEGTVIETTLVTRLDGSFSGPVNCLVSGNLYSKDRTKLLIPQGSRVLGEAEQVDGLGQKRLAVRFHRLILPNGENFALTGTPGLNQQGETGLRDKVNNHYLQVFGASLAIGAIAGLSRTNSGYGLSVEESYRRGVSDSLSQSSMRVLDRFLNVLPTLTIEAGHRVKVYLTGDLELPAYVEEREVSRD